MFAKTPFTLTKTPFMFAKTPFMFTKTQFMFAKIPLMNESRGQRSETTSSTFFSGRGPITYMFWAMTEAEGEVWVP